MEFYSRKQPRVCRSTFTFEVADFGDGMSSVVMCQALLSELTTGPATARQLRDVLDQGRLLHPLHVATDNR
eukprot:7585204-Prorocentrum_lima.AAC.1